MPPKNVKMHKNVVVRFCPHWICYWHAMNDPTCRRNVEWGVYTNLLGWLKITPRVWVWYYSLPCGDCLQHPYPDLYVLSTNYKLMRDVGVKGLFVQGARWDAGPVKDALAELRAYLHARLMWDPDYDVKKGIEEFVNAFYKGTAPYILSYIEKVHDKDIYLMDSLVASYKPKWGIPYTPEQMPGFHLPITTALAIKHDALREMDALFDQAEHAVAQDLQTLERVKLARLSLQYAILLHGDKGAPYYQKASTAFPKLLRLANINTPDPSPFR